MQEYPDSELLRLFKSDETKHLAFNIIVKRYQERLYWHIRKLVIIHDDADDILQNTFIKVWSSLQNFRHDASLYTWLYRIATNEALSWLNQKKKKSLLSLSNYDKLLENSLESDKYFNGDDLQMKLQQAILSLPAKQRAVFNMKYFDEMKYENMADILGTSIGALKASYHHAVKKIEKFIKNN
jgi:RNA polymerase sigma-70 factor (ECF subfamily)